MGFGDDMLRFNGIGERITAAMNNNDAPSAADQEAYYTIVRWAAGRGMTLTMHWGNDRSVGIAAVDLRAGQSRDTDRAAALVDRPSQRCLGGEPDADEGARRRLDDAGRDVLRRRPAAAVAGGRRRRGGRRRSRPRGRLGVVVGAGTDAHRVASYNPFTALQWILDGSSVSGAAIRGPGRRPIALGALRLYTLGSAWFSHDDDTRGSIEPGKLADLAVLSEDFMTVPVDRIGGIESVMTMVGGQVVYAAGSFAALEKR